ncbi:hypothetical protein A8C56_03010 [Niabella ginsenosidivorans]|uniref:Uncharacterized protein n=1 Tax=Niabella ginsenosidivorans TaxID=1176587 RepID=A0A1A9I040_9BACT|nr:hypothetical protein [Niabella ginsenosidivorans]ANH80091.1 hypothetical protein A8C56_03010 [Niabella ginsenosidivorans]
MRKLKRKLAELERLINWDAWGHSLDKEYRMYYLSDDGTTIPYPMGKLIVKKTGNNMFYAEEALTSFFKSIPNSTFIDELFEYPKNKDEKYLRDLSQLINSAVQPQSISQYADYINLDTEIYSYNNAYAVFIFRVQRFFNEVTSEIDKCLQGLNTKPDTSQKTTSDNPSLKYSSEDITTFVNNLIVCRRILKQDADRLIAMLLAGERHKDLAPAKWLGTNPELLYFMTLIFKDEKKHVSFAKKIFQVETKLKDNHLTKRMEKKGYLIIEQCAPV